MKSTILVVDDMPEMLGFMADLLGAAGYTVLAASTFEDGSRLAESANPDLIVTDVRLGPYNGIHLAVRQRATHPWRPMIVMSGYADPVIEAEARRQGAHFLEKSVAPERLLSDIEQMLARHRCAIGRSA
jgi:DNA-binding NtrC family response regulator